MAAGNGVIWNETGLVWGAGQFVRGMGIIQGMPLPGEDDVDL